MAMINCPECKAEVSDSALKCPSCGFQLRKSKRSIFGKIIKWAFIIFNVIMLMWVIGGGGAVSDQMDASTGDAAAEVGTAIGGALGMGMLFILWLIGDVILGMFVLFTRPKS